VGNVKKVASLDAVAAPAFKKEFVSGYIDIRAVDEKS